LDLSDGYELQIHHQPVVNPDQVALEVSPADGWGIVQVSGWSELGEAKIGLDMAKTVTVRFDRDP